jgi:NAD(P)-dependent dehydrogenase (short-subunit alcohol dehydrogenase family)
MSSLARFELAGRVAVVTGGYGVIGGSLADGLAQAGAKVAVLGRSRAAAQAKADALCRSGGSATALVADVLDRGQLEAARDSLLQTWGRVDVLVNAAGGNVSEARTDDAPVFTMALDAFDAVVRLNLNGTVLPTLVFGELMARQRKGSVVNISSLAATRALSGVPGYSAAKAGVESFTRWLAVDIARRCAPQIRVNAIAPGFFVAKQNRDVLVKPDGSPTARAESILERTPMRRFGEPAELQGAVVWLASDAASFVTGAVIVVDGGFSASSGI